MTLDAPNRSTVLRLRPVAYGCTLLIAALYGSNQARAQSTQDAAVAAPITTVKVTGIRRGIEDAISVKKSATSIVESVSAEDIGKLPDVSIAESLSRLPGLSAQRVAGRAQVISVRGLSPDFATTLLNGREQVSTGDNRSVEFDQYPSELLSGVTVYKTPDAGIVGQGLSGTLDLQTVRPLSFNGRTVALNGRLERNSLGKQAATDALGNRFSVSYIDQFLNRQLGVAIGFAHLDSPVLSQETGMYEPWGASGRPGLPAGLVNTGGTRAGVRTGFNKRDGLMAVLQYRPSKTYNSTLDLYASRFRHEDVSNQLEIGLGDFNGGINPGLQYTDVVTNGDTLGSAVAHNINPLVRGNYNERKDDIRAAGWNNEWRLDGVRVVADLSWSKAKRSETIIETNLQHGAENDAQFLDQLTFGIHPGAFPQIKLDRSYSDPSTLFIRNSIYGAGYGKLPLVEDDLKSVKLAANFDAPAALEGWFSGIDVGLHYSLRNKDKAQPEAALSLKGAPTPLPASLVNGSVDLGFAGAGVIPTWDAASLIANYLNFQPSSTLDYLISKQWQVEEKMTTAFIKANIEHELGYATLRGNVGIQVQHTDQSSDSKYYDRTAAEGQRVKSVHDGKTYTDYLPSLNLALAFNGDHTVRMAMSKQVARPRVDQLRSALDFNLDTTTRLPSGSGGNAQLDPWQAKAFDLSYEKYFGKRAYVAAAYFFKKLDTYIYTEGREYDFSAFTAGTNAVTNFGTYTAPYNGSGGTLRGVELSASLPLDVLSSSLKGFGIVVGGNYNDSSIAISDMASGIGPAIPLPGLSKYTSNLTAYYENSGFEARVSKRRRSDFIGEISNFGGDRVLRYIVGEKVYDMQFGYNFSSGWLNGVGLLLQVNNLTDAKYESYNELRTRQGDYSRYGRTVLLGASYKF